MSVEVIDEAIATLAEDEWTLCEGDNHNFVESPTQDARIYCASCGCG